MFYNQTLFGVWKMRKLGSCETLALGRNAHTAILFCLMGIAGQKLPPKQALSCKDPCRFPAHGSGWQHPKTSKRKFTKPKSLFGFLKFFCRGCTGGRGGRWPFLAACVLLPFVVLGLILFGIPGDDGMKSKIEVASFWTGSSYPKKMFLRWTGLVLASTAFAEEDLEKARLWRKPPVEKTSNEKRWHNHIFGSIIEVTTPWFLLWFVWWLRQQTLVHRGRNHCSCLFSIYMRQVSHKHDLRKELYWIDSV